MSRLGHAAGAALLLLSSLTVPAPAFAWEHIFPTPYVWITDDMPIEYWVADDFTENTIDNCDASGGASGCCEESVPSGYCKTSTDEAYDAWTAAQCAEFTYEYAGITANTTGFTYDNLNKVTYNDPFDSLEIGVLAATLTPRSTAVVETINGVGYVRALDSDIVFNNDVEFTTHEDVITGNCNGQIDMRAVMTHEVGHLLGMGHSCEDPDKGGGPCNDPLLLDATMYWTTGACDPEQATIGQDDIEGFTVLYGPFATFACSHNVTDDLAVGVVPFDLNCVVVSDFLQEVTSTNWVFGDGATSTDLNPTHTYTAPGNYTIEVTVDGERAECDDPETTDIEGWTNTYRKVGYVRACGVPEASFDVTHVDGLGYQMLNNSDVSVYGCISDIVWEVYEGDSATGEPVITDLKAWEPIIEMPDEGTFTVVMNLGGIGGTGAASVTFDAKDYRGEGYGCDTGVAGASAAGLVSLGLLIARRRRRG